VKKVWWEPTLQWTNPWQESVSIAMTSRDKTQKYQHCPQMRTLQKPYFWGFGGIIVGKFHREWKKPSLPDGSFLARNVTFPAHNVRLTAGYKQGKHFNLILQTYSSPSLGMKADSQKEALINRRTHSRLSLAERQNQTVCPFSKPCALPSTCSALRLGVPSSTNSDE